MKPTCSIVIRAYNEEKHIGRLLTGIQQQTVKDAQVILVDSGSTDSTVAIARQFGVEIVQIRPEDFSFGRSLNLGIARADSDLAVIASAHVYPVYPDWLEKILQPFQDGQVALCYGKQRGAATSKFSEHQIFEHWFPEKSQSRQPHPFCNNANSAIRKSVWEEHPYDELLPALEDLAWARWAQEKGFYIAYSADAEIIHVHNETWTGVLNRYRREGMAFKQIYPEATFEMNDLMRLWLGNVLNDWRIAKKRAVWMKNWRDILRFRWRQLYGTYRGYHEAGPLTWKLKQAFYYPRIMEENVHRPRRSVIPIQYPDIPDTQVEPDQLLK